MKRKLFICLIALLMMFSINSCETYTYVTTQDDIYVETEVDVVRSDVSFDIIIRYGTPYYMDGVLLYYLYRDIYYYPFYYNNYWYVRAYRRPFTHFDTKPYFRPHKYDHKFRPGDYRGFDKPVGNHRSNVGHRHDNRRPDVRPDNRRPNTQPNVRPENRQPNRQPNIQQSRPNRTVTPQRTPNVQNRNGNFGGRRR